jgi:hypothetical protein
MLRYLFKKIEHFYDFFDTWKNFHSSIREAFKKKNGQTWEKFPRGGGGGLTRSQPLNRFFENA